jgi:hypothetical protein
LEEILTADDADLIAANSNPAICWVKKESKKKKVAFSSRNRQADQVMRVKSPAKSHRNWG